MTILANTVTKAININADRGRTFRAVANPMNWPMWAVVNVRSVVPAEDGWFEMTTKRGKGWLKIQPDPATGLLDHTWKDEQASWKVAARVLENGPGSTFMMTFQQPPAMPDEVFNVGMRELDVELNMLKELLEEGVL